MTDDDNAHSADAGGDLADATPRWLRDERIDLTGADRFNVLPLVNDLVDLLARAPTPFTLSLSGAWGVGKSAIAETARLLLEARKIPVYYVDAWSQETDNLRRTIVVHAGARLSGKEPSDIAGQIDERLLKTISTTRDRAEFDPSAERVKEAWRERRHLFLGTVIGLLGLLALTLASTIWGTDPDRSGQGFWDLSRTVTAGLVGAAFTFLVFRSGLFLSVVSENESTGPPAAVEVALAEEFRNLVAPKDALSHKVVVIVDNLDRLQAADALDALAEIRALVEIDEQSRCLFLIPIDREAFVEQLAAPLGGPGAARDYLDKFFNLDIQLLAPAPVQMSSFAADRADELAWTEAERQAALRVVVAGANTPRYITRVMNGAATRHYLLRKVAGRPSLELLTLVEVLATAFPDLGRFLAADPLTFVEERRRVLETSDPDKRARIAQRLLDVAAKRRRWTEDPGAAPVEELSAEGAPTTASSVAREPYVASLTVDRLQRFLATTHAVEVTPEAIQLAALLRPDPIWHGIKNAVALRQAMHTGDRGAFKDSLEQAQEVREPALVAALNELSKNVADGRNDLAVRGIGAAGEDLLAANSHTRDLYGQAIDAVTGVDTAQLMAAPPPLVSVLGQTQAAQAGQRQRLWARIRSAATETASSETPRFGQLVPIAIAALPPVPDSAGTATATAFESATDDDLVPLFEPTAIRALITPKLIERHTALLSGWDHTSEDTSNVLVATRRLSALLGAEWDGASALDAVAAELTTSLASYEATPVGNAVIGSMADLFAALKGTASIDSLASTLMGRAQADSSLASIALRLPFTDAAGVELKASLESYVSSTYDAEGLRHLADESGPVLDRLGIGILRHGAARWVAAADESFLQMVMDRGTGGDACFDALDSQPANAATMNLAVQLAGASRSRRRTGLLKRISVKAGSTAASLPVSTISTHVEALVTASHGTNAETDRAVSMALAQALRGPVATVSDAATVSHFGAAGRVLGTPDAEKALAISIAERAHAASISGIDPDTLEWLIRRSRKAAATSLLRREIEGGNQLAAMIGVSRSARAYLSSERQIRTALVGASAELSARGPAYGITAEQVIEPLRLVAEWVDSRELRADEVSMVDAIASGPFAAGDQLIEVLQSLRDQR